MDYIPCWDLLAALDPETLATALKAFPDLSGVITRFLATRKSLEIHVKPLSEMIRLMEDGENVTETQVRFYKETLRNFVCPEDEIFHSAMEEVLNTLRRTPGFDEDNFWLMRKEKLIKMKRYALRPQRIRFLISYQMNEEQELLEAVRAKILEEEERAETKDAVEAYIYDMRNKLHDKYQEFVIEADRDAFISTLQGVEDWLNEDGKDETKEVYLAKLDELKEQGDPIEERYKEHSERGIVVDQLIYCINSCREAAMSSDPMFEHIELRDKQEVLNECLEAEAWIREKKQHQDTLPKYATPVLLSGDVRITAEALDRFCRTVMTKPKPAKPATPEALPPASESHSQGGAGSASPGPNANTAGSENEVPPANTEPMEMDKSEAGPTSH